MSPQSVDAMERVRQRYAAASSLTDTLTALLEEVADTTPFERSVAAAGFDRHLVGAGVGVAGEEIAAFARAMARNSSQSVADGRGMEGHEESPLTALGSFRSPVLVPAVTPSEDFVAVVAVEAQPHHPALAKVREALRIGTPFIFRSAELHALRARVAGLDSQRRRTDRALDALPDPVLVMDADSRILLSNRRAGELLITSPGDSRGRRHAVETNNLFFSAFRARALLEVDQVVGPRELLLVDPADGSDLLFEVFPLPFHDPESLAESYIFVLRDITDLKVAARELEVQVSRSVAAEHRMRRESQRLNVIIENAGIPILVTDRATNVLLMNREAERLLEASQPDSRHSLRVHDIRENDAKLAGFISEFLLHSRLRREGHLTLVDPDEAREFPALAVSTKILDERGEPTAMVTILHDLTQEVENRHLAQELQSLNTELEARVVAATAELAQRNAQLMRQRSELERASRMKSEFLATMSHELRTPINAVLGYNSLLREGLFGKLSEKQDDALLRMRRAAEHLLSLINDILDLSRVEAGKVQLTPVEIEWKPFLDTLSETVRPMAALKSLEYAVELDPRVPKISADETRLRQVLLNLLSNAVKFTDRGSVRLQAKPSDDRWVRLEVVDTGIGIEPQNLDVIFEEFTQVDQSATREHGGTGLGLAISRRLIGVMGGKLGVISTPGSGSTFWVDLPVASPTSEADGR
jgi:signal transduction histidine kinase